MDKLLEGYTEADKMRWKLERVNLIPTPEGERMARRERKGLTKTIMASLPNLPPGDLFSIYLIVTSLANNGAGASGE